MGINRNPFFEFLKSQVVDKNMLRWGMQTTGNKSQQRCPQPMGTRPHRHSLASRSEAQEKVSPGETPGQTGHEIMTVSLEMAAGGVPVS